MVFILWSSYVRAHTLYICVRLHASGRFPPWLTTGIPSPRGRPCCGPEPGATGHRAGSPRPRTHSPVLVRRAARAQRSARSPAADAGPRSYGSCSRGRGSAGWCQSSSGSATSSGCPDPGRRPGHVGADHGRRTYGSEACRTGVPGRHRQALQSTPDGGPAGRRSPRACNASWMPTTSTRDAESR